MFCFISYQTDYNNSLKMKQMQLNSQETHMLQTEDWPKLT